MARNKDLPSKLRRSASSKKSRSIPSWIILRSGGKVRSSPYSQRQWRNTRLKRD